MLATYSPTPEIDFSALDRSGKAPGTLRHYKAALTQLILSGISPFDYETLADYAASLPPSGRSNLKAALNIVTRDYVNRAKAGATTHNHETVQAFLWKIDAMNEAIQITQPKGKRAAIWLTPAQIEQIMSIPDRSTIRGRRDWIVLAVLFGAGLRREELASLQFSDIKQQPMASGQNRAVLDVLGKGNKRRTIPISSHLAQRLAEWQNEIGDGNVVRAINKADKPNGSLSSNAIYDIVGLYGTAIGLPDLQTHDCRRSYAQLGLNAGIPIQQISTLLGHANLATTQKYLDLHISLETTISDFVPLAGD